MQLSTLYPIYGKSIKELSKHVVYTLVNPIDSSIFYVGTSRGNVEDRYRRHITELKAYSHEGSRKIDMIKRIKSKGLLPLMYVQNTYKSEEMSLKAEREMKKQLHESGVVLVNYGHSKSTAKTRVKLLSSDLIDTVFNHPAIAGFVLLVVLLVVYIAYVDSSNHNIEGSIQQ